MTDELMALLAKATAGEWQQGRLLSTEQTRRFSFEQRADFDDMEKGSIYVNFSAEDEGLSRSRIGIVDNGLHAHDNAAAIVAAVNWCRNELPALIEREKALRELLIGSTERMAATLAAMDKYNEANGTHIVGPSLLGLGVQIAGNRAALAGQP